MKNKSRLRVGDYLYTDNAGYIKQHRALIMEHYEFDVVKEGRDLWKFTITAEPAQHMEQMFHKAPKAYTSNVTKGSRYHEK